MTQMAGYAADVPPRDMRAVARRAVETEIAAVAVDLFGRQGFEATTVAQIAEAAGISQRTFFRYFATKQDAVVGQLAELGAVLHDALVARPDDEDPWAALGAALHELAEANLADPDWALRSVRMLATTPALRAAQIDKHQAWQASLVPEVARRLRGQGADDPELAAAALVAAALGCLDVASEAWVAGDGAEPFGALLDRALRAVRPY
jgi:AcrR family transcriptional regulator